jgi:hypothetical protein
MLTSTYFTSFAQVEHAYFYTTPLRGRHASDDVRPIGDRARPWERIVKISNDCYALSDGMHFGDPIYETWNFRYKDEGERPAVYTAKDMEYYAPIVWRRYKDGSETVKVMNGTGDGLHTGRFAFFDRHLPRGLYFHNKNGHHSVNGLYLAKGSKVHPDAWENLQIRRAAYTDKGNPVPNYLSYYTKHSRNEALVFKKIGADWEHTSGGMPEPEKILTRVDKDKKTELAPHLDAFREWAAAILPLLDDGTYTAMNERRAALKETMDAETAAGRRGDFCVQNQWNFPFRLNAEVATMALCDLDNPYRVYLAFALGREPNVRQADTAAAWRTAYNKWANKTFELTMKVKADE